MANLSSPGQKELDDLASYLNNQPDVLIAIVKHQTSYKGETGDLHIIKWDPEGAFVTLLLHPPGKKDSLEFNIPFNPPIKTPYQARPRMYTLRDMAFKKYNLPLRPPIKYYSPPSPFPYALPLGLGILATLFAKYGMGQYADQWRGWITKNFGKYMVEAALLLIIVLHGFEAAYMVWALRKHQTPLEPSIKWVLTVLAFGIGGITEFWDSIQYERIRMIYRQTDVGEIAPRVQGDEVKVKKTQ